MKTRFVNILKLFIPLAAGVTIMVGLVYVAVQQNFRQNANDPQIQIAEDLARQISAAQSIPQISANLNVDIAKSLGTFVLIYDNDKKVITGSGQLNGQYPILPDGIYNYVRNSGEDRLTWEPAPGMRVALVVTRFENKNQQTGFVAAGRSLREVEKREHMLTWYVLGAWFVALVASLILIVAGEVILARNTS